MGSFLDVVLPPIFWAVMTGVVIITCVVLLTAKTRSYAQRYRAAAAARDGVTGQDARQALASAREVLIILISDGIPPREQSITAYDQVNSVLKREK